jgi:hypothetical protein
MNPEEQARASRLGQTWDDLVSGHPSSDASMDLLSEIQFAQEVTSVPSPPTGLQAKVWRRVHGGELPSALSAIAISPSPNGVAHHDIALDLNHRTIAARTLDLLGIGRILAIGMIAGFAAGFMSGLWVRLAMRIAGSLTSDRNRGLLTQEEAAVGQLTIGGTLFLAMFAAMVGIVGGVVYLAVRRWLPRQPAMRAVSYGVLLLAVFGFIVMDENNTDYQLFGPTLLNVGSFSLTYLVFGVLVSVLVDGLDRRVPRPRPLASNHARTGAIVLLASIAILLVRGFGPGFAVAGLAIGLLLTICLRRFSTRTSWRLDFDSPVFLRVSALGLIVPGLFGFYLTVQGIVAILAG